MVRLTNVRIAHTALGGRIVLARFGKDLNVALETADAQSDFFKTLVSFAFDGRVPEPGEAVEVSFGGGDEQFCLTVRRQALEAHHEQ